MPQLTSQTGLYDPAQNFAIALVPQTINASVLLGNVITFTTAAAHGFAAILAAFQKTPGYSLQTGAGVQLGVIISGGAGPTILNSTWLVAAAPTGTTFTTQLTPAQAAQAAGSLVGATATPFMTLPPGNWDILLGSADLLLWATTMPPGPVGGVDTTVAGVQGGSVVGFGLLGAGTGVPIGNGTYVTFLGGANPNSSDMLSTDGVSFFIQFGAGAGTSYAKKRLGTF